MRVRHTTDYSKYTKYCRPCTDLMILSWREGTREEIQLPSLFTDQPVLFEVNKLSKLSACTVFNSISRDKHTSLRTSFPIACVAGGFVGGRCQNYVSDGARGMGQNFLCPIPLTASTLKLIALKYGLFCSPHRRQLPTLSDLFSPFPERGGHTSSSFVFNELRKRRGCKQSIF